MLIPINPHSSTPIFQQIHDRIVEAIAQGHITPGEQLAPVRSLALDFGINPATAKKAYDLLKTEGIITTSMREGSVVVGVQDPHPDHLSQFQEDLTTLLSKAYCQGIHPEDVLAATTRVLQGFSPTVSPSPLPPSSPSSPSSISSASSQTH